MFSNFFFATKPKSSDMQIHVWVETLSFHALRWKKKKRKIEIHWQKLDMMYGRPDFCLWNPILIFCHIRTPLPGSPRSHNEAEAVRRVKAAYEVCCWRAEGGPHSSALSLALSKSRMVTSMQSLIKHTKRRGGSGRGGSGSRWLAHFRHQTLGEVGALFVWRKH